MATGRPTDFTPELGAEICLKMIENDPPDNNIKKICASSEKYPCFKTFYSWLHKADQVDASEEFKNFLHQYKTALKIRDDIYHDECMNIAYDDSGDILVGAQGDKGNSTAVSRSKVKIDTIQWLLKVSNPKKYGDKSETIHSGEVTMNAADSLINALGSYGEDKKMIDKKKKILENRKK